MARASAFQAEGCGFESRFPLQITKAHVAQSVEHFLGKEEVTGSIPVVGSNKPRARWQRMPKNKIRIGRGYEQEEV